MARSSKNGRDISQTPAITAATNTITRKGCRLRSLSPFVLKNRHVLTIKNEQATISPHHKIACHQVSTGSPFEKCTTEARTPAAAGIGMPTKYFLPGRPGFEGSGFT